jgi:ribose 5-phosphate isomerase A
MEANSTAERPPLALLSCNAPHVSVSGAYEFSPERTAAAEAAAELLEGGMVVGLGSGRAVWAVVEAIVARFGPRPPIKVVVASDATYAIVHAAGIQVIPLNGDFELDVAIDGADEVDPRLRLLKGGGGALLREKLVASAARRFVVVAEQAKRVDRLGKHFRLPVEVVRFGWRDTRRRISDRLPDAQRRDIGDEPYMTDEGHFILDCAVPEGTDVSELADSLDHVPGVVEHGLFLDMAERALLGRPDGTVEVLEASKVS